METAPEHAMRTLNKAMRSDSIVPGSYANAWHCNIAMMCYEALRNHQDSSFILTDVDAKAIGNEAASRFMKLCFGVVTKG